MNSKKKIRRWFIIIIGILGIFIICIYLQLLENQKMTEEEKSQKIEEEIERLSKYFEEKYDYYLQRIPDWVSIGPHTIGVNELKYTRYILVKKENLDTSKGHWIFCFSSKQEVVEIFNQLSEDEKKEYILVSRSIICIELREKEEYQMSSFGGKKIEYVAKLRFIRNLLSCSL